MAKIYSYRNTRWNNRKGQKYKSDIITLGIQGSLGNEKRDILTPIGLVLCFGLIIWGMATGGSSLKVFWDLASVFITIGGSLTAMLITYPIDEFKRLL